MSHEDFPRWPNDTSPAEALAAQHLARLSNRTRTPSQILALDAAAIDRGLAKLYACLGWEPPVDGYRVVEYGDGYAVQPGGQMPLGDAMRAAAELARWA